MRVWGWLLCLGMLSAGAAELPYRKTVSVLESSAAAQVITIDEELFRHTVDGFADVRISDAGGITVPYAVTLLPEKWEEQNVYAVVSGKITGFSVDPKANTATLRYEWKQSVPVGKLYLEYDRKQRFRKTISLTFDDGSRVEGLEFFNHPDTMQFHSRDFVFAPRNARSVTITISPFVETRSASTALEHRGVRDTFTESRLITEELSLDQIAVFEVKKSWNLIARQQPRILQELERKTQNGVTEILLDAGRQPLSALTIGTETPDYRRQVKITSLRRDLRDPGQWHTADTVQATISPAANRIGLNGGCRPDRIRVEIRNGDDPPLNGLQLHCSGYAYGLLMDNAALQPGILTVRYGDPAAGMPEYGIRQYQEKFHGKPWQELNASPQEILADPPVCNWDGIPRSIVPWILGAACGILALFAWKMFRKITPEQE